MPEINEKLLQFIWQHRLLSPGHLVTTSGNEIIILKPGDLNKDAGPDFFNGQIILNGLTLAGNIEIHLRSSDWLKHGHQNDKNYDNIILHVVYDHDLSLRQNEVHQVEVLELKNHIPEKTLEAYGQLAASSERLPCSNQLKDVPDFKLIAWMERMAIERLSEKTDRIERLYSANNSDLTQTFYTLVLRNFGFKVNALPFELLTKLLPAALLLRHSNNVFQLESLLLGMAGMLDEQYAEKYIRDLQNEFMFMKEKYQLVPLKRELFKFSKLRPANFPDLRLAQFATLVHKAPELFTDPQRFSDLNALKRVLGIKPKGYWQRHYTIGGKTANKDLSFGDDSVENIVINSIAPFFFFYGKKFSKPRFSDLGIQLLASTGFETNTKTRLFAAKKSVLLSAADSQGIINLYDNYCTRKQCLKCGIASAILR